MAKKAPPASSLSPPTLTASTASMSSAASTTSVALAPRAGPLNIRRVTWPAGEAIHGIHLNVYAADEFNLETAVGCARVCRDWRARQGETTQWATAHKAEQRSMARQARCNRVHSAVTHQVMRDRSGKSQCACGFPEVVKRATAVSRFNPGLKGNARFSPIQSAAGVPIPTLYGGTTFECAAMETVFHDVPFAPGIKQHDKAKLAGQTYSQLTLQVDLKLVDLSVVALRNLGVQRDRLIDTESSEYPITRLWAQAFHTRFPDIQGLWWVSRQDDRARAIVLFGDRIKPNDLVQTSVSRDVLDDDDAYTALLQLANTIGVRLVAGKVSGP